MTTTGYKYVHVNGQGWFTRTIIVVNNNGESVCPSFDYRQPVKSTSSEWNFSVS